MPFFTEGQATSENLLQLTRLPVFTSNFLASDPPYVFLLCMLFSPMLRRSSRPAHRLLPLPNLNWALSIARSCPSILVCAASYLCKHAVAAEPNSPIYQFENYLLALVADGCDMFHLDKELTAAKVCPCFFAKRFSAAQGAMRFSSITGRRCLALSISEIFSITFSHAQLKARRTPNPSRSH
jgi:hypothetical protein